MENYGFEIELNGIVLTRAGFDNPHFVLTCILNSIRRKMDKSEELNLSVGGLNVDTDEHVSWLHQNLELGDDLRIKIIKGGFDTPTPSGPRLSEEEIIKRKINYFHELKKELKGYLDEK